MRRELERIEIPDEHEARVRAWQLVEAAFAERVPPPRRTWPRTRVAVALAVAAGVVAAAASPPGRSVVTSIRERIGVESAEPSLFSLPAPGRVLVSSPNGSWVVDADGSKRRLGAYTDAAWSPFGRFVVATRRNELAALEPDGDIRWTLARPQLGPFAWGGTRNDTRIAYATGTRLHVVGGDGRGDQRLFTAPDVPTGPIAWARGSRRVLAHATQGILRVLDAGARGEEMWSATVPQPRFLAWTDDRARLVSLSRDTLVVFDRNGRRLFRHVLAGRATAMSVRPNGRQVAIALRLRGSTRSELFVFSLDRRDAPQRRLFGGAGTFSAVAWSPDTRWLLVAWNEADQWVFLRTRGAPRIAAAANVAEQFDGVFPEVESWCCAP